MWHDVLRFCLRWLSGEAPATRTYFYRPITGPSRQRYILIGRPKGLPIIESTSTEPIPLEGP